ncbi:MAG TPA: response regulator transcription factor [Phycisphaerae bacterium]|nr:response regulator transcription factor [Phycisphaerae bacterium]
MALGKIVVVEDEEPIREGIAAALRAAGYEPIEAGDGEAGLAAGRRPGVDLVLLDLLLPKMDGMDVLRNLRQTHPTLPIIVLTARGAEDERVAGLKAGADDYVVKPFSARELIARVGAVLRRSPERPEIVTLLLIADATVDLARREVRAEPAQIQALSETECAILTHLAANHGRAISRDELLTRVWGLSGAGIETRTIDMHVARLRSKLSAVSGCAGESIIATVRGKGYMLGPDVRLPEGPGGGGPKGGRK